jgi:molybdate-binding protein
MIDLKSRSGRRFWPLLVITCACLIAAACSSSSPPTSTSSPKASSSTASVADAGVASEPAALAYGLAFLPLTDEHVDLVIPADQAGSREVQALLKVLASPWLLAQLTILPGYDPVRCGEHIASL